MPPFKVGQRVRIGGLTSEAGLKLNGKAGVVIKLIQKTGRYRHALPPVATGHG